MTDTAVRPRDAASLILHRRRSGQHQILMGRRPATARFMPGVYVFPGGAVENSDRHVRPASALPRHLPALLKVGSNASRARAMAISAIRETQEETGLLVGKPGDPGLTGSEAWQAWREHGLAPDLGCLDLMARAITPPSRPIRFHARFFIASGDHTSGEIGGDGELEDIGWVDLNSAHELKLADIQRFLLAHLEEVLSAGRPAQRRPLFTHRRGQRHIRWG